MAVDGVMDGADRVGTRRRLILWAVDQTQGVYLRDWQTHRFRAERRMRSACEPTRVSGGAEWMAAAADSVGMFRAAPPAGRDPDAEDALLAVSFDELAAVVVAGLEGRTAQRYDECMRRILEVMTMTGRPQGVRDTAVQRLAEASRAVVENGLRLLAPPSEEGEEEPRDDRGPAWILLTEVAKVVGLENLFPGADRMPRAIARARAYGDQVLPDGRRVLLDRGNAELVDADGVRLARLRWYDLARWIDRATTPASRAEYEVALAEHDELSQEVWTLTVGVVEAVLALGPVVEVTPAA